MHRARRRCVAEAASVAMEANGPHPAEPVVLGCQPEKRMVLLLSSFSNELNPINFTITEHSGTSYSAVDHQCLEILQELKIP